jgi:hypothetical protein
MKFPAKPTEKDVPTSAGIPRRQFLAPLHGGQLVYSLQYAEGPPPEDARHSLVLSQDGMVQALGGTLLKEREIQLGKWPGRAFSFTFSTRVGPGIQHARVFLVNRRVYILTVAGHPDRVNERDAEAFFDSFFLVES